MKGQVTSVYHSGRDIATRLGGLADEQTQVQPAGVDLTVDEILRFEDADAGRIGTDGKSIVDRNAVAAVGDPPAYELDPGAYIVVYGETIRIPEDAVGFVYPRSSLMRNGAMLHTAVWDPGYSGRGEGLLEVNHPVEVEAGARVAQLVYADAAAEGEYTGGYDGERLDGGG